MGSGVGSRVFGTEKRFSGVRVPVLGGFELNDENNLKTIYFSARFILVDFRDVTKGEQETFPAFVKGEVDKGSL